MLQPMGCSAIQQSIWVGRVSTEQCRLFLPPREHCWHQGHPQARRPCLSCFLCDSRAHRPWLRTPDRHNPQTVGRGSGHVGSALAWDTSPQPVMQMHTKACTVLGLCPWLASWPGVKLPKGDWEHKGTLAQPLASNLRAPGSAAPNAALYDLKD